MCALLDSRKGTPRDRADTPEVLRRGTEYKARRGPAAATSRGPTRDRQRKAAGGQSPSKSPPSGGAQLSGKKGALSLVT